MMEGGQDKHAGGTGGDMRIGRDQAKRMKREVWRTVRAHGAHGAEV